MRNRGLHSCVLSFCLSRAREREASKDEGGRRRISRRSSSAFLAPAALQPGLRPPSSGSPTARLSAKPPPIRSAIDEARFDWSISRENRDFFTGGFFSVREPPNARPSFSRCARGKIKQISVRREIAACASPARSGVGGIRGVALNPGARVARHAHRHHVRHSGHVCRQRLRARRCVARPHRARASPRGAPRGVAVLDIVPPFFFPSASSRGTIMTTSDAPRDAPRSAPISRPDLARRLTTLPRAPISLPPQPPRRSAPTPPGTRARERRPRSSSEARLRQCVATTRLLAMRVNRSLDPFPFAHFRGCR